VELPSVNQRGLVLVVGGGGGGGWGGGGDIAHRLGDRGCARGGRPGLRVGAAGGVRRRAGGGAGRGKQRRAGCRAGHGDGGRRRTPPPGLGGLVCHLGRLELREGLFRDRGLLRRELRLGRRALLEMWAVLPFYNLTLSPLTQRDSLYRAASGIRQLRVWPSQ
jgi:hypothetical protein